MSCFSKCLRFCKICSLHEYLKANEVKICFSPISKLRFHWVTLYFFVSGILNNNAWPRTKGCAGFVKWKICRKRFPVTYVLIFHNSSNVSLVQRFWFIVLKINSTLKIIPLYLWITRRTFVICFNLQLKNVLQSVTYFYI